VAALAQDNAVLPRDLTPWGMFVNADEVVKAVLIGLEASRHFMTVGLGVLAPLAIWRMIPIPAPNRRWGSRSGKGSDQL
jgi:hypothetical protein